ncbi:hypothetical protein JIN84_22285 [Luteolibacter yonseiensis]|uniref:Uncharacterized protein n=1 Tax=Luteolibacter yonseiensis TaxID=1144680 RepID=A0A934VE85_9BACT|nr:hypothetical protein [Luteolibacter yonseiensis]MBK1818364.1 hypothetical protein [Luteolibacter yonseiensis]
MRKFLLSMVGVFAMSSLTGMAAEPTKELLPKDAVRLISMKSNVQDNTIQISFIVEGSERSGDGFEVKHVRRVAAILPVRDGASQARKMVFYNLFWNESLGWFMWESRQERTGEAVYIWSELKGEIVNR